MHTQGFFFLIFDSRQYAVSQLEGNIASLDPTSHRAKKERERERETVYMCQRESMTVLPNALNMTHALNGLKQLGIKSTLGPRKLSSYCELQFTTQAIVSHGTTVSVDELEPKLYISPIDLQRYTHGTDSKQ